MRDTRQTCDTVLLVRPACFGFHAEAAQSNAFAQGDDGGDVQELALREFEGLQAALEDAGVRCLILDDQDDVRRPDAIFPNNWVTFHGDGTAITYPMANEARRLERRLPAVTDLLRDAGLKIETVIDLSPLEVQGQFLEGTGSLIFDRPNSRAFACRSPRTSEAAVAAFTESTGWDVVLFDAADRAERQIYHTNVMLSIGTDIAIICGEAVADQDRARLLAALGEGGRAIVEVTFDQMERFACNVIELGSRDGTPLFAMSRSARDAFTPEQREVLERHGRLVVADIPTIERIGGGSVRCMIAEVFVPLN